MTTADNRIGGHMDYFATRCVDPNWPPPVGPRHVLAVTHRQPNGMVVIMEWGVVPEEGRTGPVKVTFVAPPGGRIKTEEVRRVRMGDLIEAGFERFIR